MRRALVLVPAALLAATGCERSWQAFGGEADLAVRGAMPWTDEEHVAAHVEVFGENDEDQAIVCAALVDGSYDVTVSTTFVDGLKRLKLGVTIDRWVGTSSYGGDDDPSGARGRMTLREDGEESWFSADDRFPCVGWVDEEQLRGEFSCTGVVGGPTAHPRVDGPMDFDLSYFCGPDPSSTP